MPAESAQFFGQGPGESLCEASKTPGAVLSVCKSAGENTRQMGLGITPAVMKRCQWINPCLSPRSNLPSGRAMISFVIRSSMDCELIKRQKDVVRESLEILRPQSNSMRAQQSASKQSAEHLIEELASPGGLADQPLWAQS